MGSEFDLQFTGQADILAGSDEVGRGPLAGPVVAATAFLQLSDKSDVVKTLLHLDDLGVWDSKKLNSQKRQQILRKLGVDWAQITADAPSYLMASGSTICYLISLVLPEEIDRINILQASLLSMERSFLLGPDTGSERRICWLVDGNRAPRISIPNVTTHAIVKGDAKSTIIALASIIAKEYRDNLMLEWHKIYPQYGFEQNAGYPTAFHLAALKKFGPSSIHRKTFRGVLNF